MSRTGKSCVSMLSEAIGGRPRGKLTCAFRN